ncbi:alanine racemase [Comamonas serinivorans]|uniref:Alanine racemase n=1 Tax=Comamonas serinivorans TaxID=1082851 RepID=A0A1Y0ERW1_9BURK|nr:DSD1 family PLP-dependent enzyme [Comamonas serinivorans]ARU05992.1 alanine racemase [Comamonas serinivorans]
MSAALDTRTPQHLTVVGMPVHDLPTPCLVVDLDALNRNVQRMAAYCARHKVRLRPHAKTHKSADIGRVQMQAGAVGVCVQKVSEAEALVDVGASKLLITNEVIAPLKLMRVAELAQCVAGRNGQLGIVVDSLQGIDALGAAMALVHASIDVYVEINVGQNRCGVPPGEAAVPLAQAIGQHANMRFAGLQAYNGKLQHARTVAARRQAVADVAVQIQATRDALHAAGLPVPLVTGGGTGAFAIEIASGQYDEIQAGSYVFMDAEYMDNERDPSQPEFENSLFVLTQVMSVSADHVVCDAGHKSHAIDAGLPRVWTAEDETPLVFANGGDEHGILRAAQPGEALPALGSLIWLIPGHCDPTVNLHRRLYGVRGGLRHGRVDHVIRVDARGCVQ